jgi:hypothetical protein
VADAAGGGRRGGEVPAHRAARGDGRHLRGVGIGCLLGTTVEPVTRRPRAWSPATRYAIAFNVAASAALIAAGGRHLAAARMLPDR